MIEFFLNDECQEVTGHQYASSSDVPENTENPNKEKSEIRCDGVGKLGWHGLLRAPLLRGL